MILSIIVCTHNRADLLKNCLVHLLPQLQPNCEIIVVSSACTDHTPQVLAELPHEALRVVAATTAGLSHARNVGVAAAQSPNIAFIDDDAYPNPDFVAQSIYLVKNHNYACVGGIYEPWYLYGKPNWYQDAWVSSQVHGTELCAMPAGCYVSGGVVIYQKKAVLNVGGFDVLLGMNAQKVAYGEETELQNRLVAQGYTVAYQPKLVVQHLVPKYKLSPSWLLKSAFAKGKNHWRTHHKKPGFILLLKIGVAMLVHLFGAMVKSVPKLFKKNYYWQNAFIEILEPFCFGLGRILGAYLG